MKTRCGAANLGRSLLKAGRGQNCRPQKATSSEGAFSTMRGSSGTRSGRRGRPPQDWSPVPQCSLRRILSLSVILSAAALAADTPRQHPLTSLPVTSVRIDDKFWAPRIEINRTHTLETVHRKLIETGAIQNFAIAAGRAPGKFRGPFWSDSDVYKWLEGNSWSLAERRDAQLEAASDEVIASIAAAQMPDGYLDTYFQLVEPELRWKYLAFGHEMFCAGHMYEAATAHFEATGKRTLLNVAIKHADHVDAYFGPGKHDGQPGHEEIELGLVKLYRATGEKRYLKLAAYFLDQRGQKPSLFEREYEKLDPARTTEFLGRTITFRTLQDALFRKDPSRFDTQYSQDHLPVRQQDKVVGHAVRAMYLYSGMADVAGEMGDTGLFEAATRLYRDLTTKRIYVTGGIGPSVENEGFTRDYDLPNETAYQETCASIGVAMWADRMLALTGDAQYADTMETALYNGFPAGVSLDGDTFFYDNPLYSAGKATRKTWFTVPCCPTNVARIMPSIGKYIYSQSDDALWVNLYVQSKVTAGLPLAVSTDYPWSGAVTLKISQPSTREYGLRLRIPGWAGGADFRLNNQPVHPPIDKGYAVFHRSWATGDVIQLNLSMPVELLEANPGVIDDRGRVALRRGPVIYALEQTDNRADLDRLVLARSPKLEAHYEPRVLKGVAVITGQAMLKPAGSWHDQLYRTTRAEALEGPVNIRAVPYCTWANRGSGKMAVWIESSK